MKTPRRFPLYARVLCWFFGIVALLGGALVWALRSTAAGDWLMMQQAEPRVQSVARLLLRELQPLPPAQWTEVLKKYSDTHGMDFALFSGARQIAGAPVELPPALLQRLPDRPPGQPRPGMPPAAGNRPLFNPGNTPEGPYAQDRPPRVPGDNGGVFRPDRMPREQPDIFPGAAGPPPPQPDRPFPKFLHRTPEAHWISVVFPLRQQDGNGSTSLILRITDPAASGLAQDFTPWVWGGAALLLLASLLWLIPVRGMTRAVAQMQRATSAIASGKFDIQVPSRRRDELGELAAEINRLGARLSGFVTGQKRFLGDIAHELCAPLARMQMAGAALEQRAPEALRERIADLSSDVESMSLLVSELLDFSRAGLAPQKVLTTPVLLSDLITSVLERESATARATVNIPPNLAALANPGLLTRALGNVIRNSLRYAGPAARLEIHAAPAPGGVRLSLSDNGPGVPPDALPRLFDPFFRLEESRDRESGGTGLGLAIVKTCVESFGGTVLAENRPGGGLTVEFRLPTAAG